MENGSEHLEVAGNGSGSSVPSPGGKTNWPTATPDAPVARDLSRRTIRGSRPGRAPRGLDFESRRAIPRPDANTFVQLRTEHGDVVRGQLRRCSSWLSREDAEELEQTVWLAAWIGLVRFRGDSTFSTWLMAITRRTIGSWLRQARSRRIALTQFACDKQINGEPGWEIRIVRRLTIQEALVSLPARQLQAVRLRYYDDLSDEEISQTLSLPLGTVKGRIRTGLQRLRTLICGARQRPAVRPTPGNPRYIQTPPSRY